MNEIRKYVLELDVPDIIDPDTDYNSPYEYKDDEWVSKGGKVNTKVLGKYITRYLNIMYQVFEGVRGWSNRVGKTDKGTLLKIQKIIDKNLINYPNPPSTKKLSSEFKRLGVKMAEIPESFVMERRMKLFTKVMKGAEGVTSLVSLAGALLTIGFMVDKLIKSFKIVKNDNVTRIKSGAIFEGTIIPGLKTLMGQILYKKISEKQLRDQMFKIQDKVIQLNPPLKSHLTFLSEPD